MAQDSNQTKHSEQNILNNVYDTLLRSLAVTQMGYTGQGTQATVGQSMALKLTTGTNVVYLAIAAPGSNQSSAVWQARKIDTSSGVVITWADGDASFDNVATDLTALSYS